MSVSELLKRTEKLVVDNSPAILTALGVTGAITTAYLTGRASYKAALIIDQVERKTGTAGDRRERIRQRTELVWRLYIPVVGTGVLTVACIIGANRIGTRRAAALAAAYTLSERAFSEYKDKVIETIGTKNEQELRDELARERVSRTTGSSEVVVLDGRQVLCFDSYTGRYFLSSMEELRAAQNKVNHRILNQYYASLGDYYTLVGLNSTALSEEVG